MKPDLSMRQRSGTSVEPLLTRTVLRLCGAVSGIDPALDPYLQQIKNLVKSGVTPDMNDNLGQLTRALAQAADQRASPGVLHALAERAGLSGDRRLRAGALWSELVRDPAAIDDARLDQLAELLGMATTLDSGAAGDDTETTLRRLLDSVDWPTRVSREISKLRSQLISPGAWVGVVDALCRLLVRVLTEVREETEEAGDFLLQLDQQLQAIGGYLHGESHARDETAKAVRVLDDQVRGDVGEIRAAIASPGDLAEMQGRVVGGLKRLQGRLDSFIAREEAVCVAASEREQSLRLGLEQLEAEATELRRKLAHSNEEARQDPLTGLPNRRAYDERAAHECARFRRNGNPFGVMLLDIDKFKQINDQYGHQVGDQVLQQLATTLSAQLRETDFLARFGGEEFVLLLIDVDRAGAYLIAEKMRRAVERQVAAAEQPVTVSAGLTLLGADGDLEAALKRADQALYQAKAHGRNRCMMT